MIKRITALLFVLLLISAPLTSAAAAKPFTLPSGYPGGEKQNPVEQQSDFPWLPGPLDCSNNLRCVKNPTQCSWDVDDHWQFVEIDRVLDAKTTVTGTVCSILDANPQYVTEEGYTAWWQSPRGNQGMQIFSTSPDLIITVTYQPQNKVFTLGNVWNASYKEYEYRFCANVVYNPTDPALVPIPDSAWGPNNTNGLGVKTDITITVTNPTRQAVRRVTADIQQIGVLSTGPGCINATYNVDYPFTWLTT